MNKEEYRKAFNAGKEYWQWVQTDEPMLHKPIDFDEWYDTVVLPQANVISWCRNNQDTLLLIGIGLLFQLIFFIGVIISGTCL